MEGPREAQWASDPYRRHELRYWDGVRWTEHVSEGDGAILLDPPLPAPVPAPRTSRRQLRMAADDGASLADYVGGPARTMTAAPDRLSVVVVPTPARGTPRARAPFGPTPLPYGVPTGPAAPSVPFDGAGRPDRFAAPGPAPASRRPGPGPAQQAAPRRADLFAELPGVTPQRAAAGGPPSGPVAFAMGDPGEGRDWRESRLPEALSALGVAALIGLAAFAGSGGFSSSPQADAGDEVVPGASAPATAGSKPAATTKTKKRKVPGVQLSSAPPGRIIRTSSSTARRTSRTTAPSKTSSPPSKTSSPPSSSSTSESPSSSSSSSASSSASSSSSK